MAQSIGGTQFAHSIEAVCISESLLWEVPLYHISMKSCQGNLFQGPVEYSDNSRVDRFARATSMEMAMYKHAICSFNESLVCTYNVCVRTFIVVDPYHVARFQWQH